MLPDVLTLNASSRTVRTWAVNKGNKHTVRKKKAIFNVIIFIIYIIGFPTTSQQLVLLFFIT